MFLYFLKYFNLQFRITNAIIWGVGGGLIAGIIALVSSYYTGA